MNAIKCLIKFISNRKYHTKIQRLNTSHHDENYDKEIKKVINLINYTKRNAVSYSAGHFNSGYHSLKIGEYYFKGQRDPMLRFKDIPFSLKGCTVLDIGCNQGGMLYSFSDQIKYGVGIDFDYKMINAANKIKSYSGVTNTDYYVFDLEHENLDYLYDFIPGSKIDVIFLLSVCMWIKNWKEVIDFCKKSADKLLFETNGNAGQQNEQIEHLKKLYNNVLLIHESSEDDPSQKFRKLFICSS